MNHTLVCLLLYALIVVLLRLCHPSPPPPPLPKHYISFSVFCAGSQFLEPDGWFPNHVPNPEDATAMAAGVHAVQQSGSDLGVVLDTDVDRSAVVARDGQPINSNRYIALMSLITLRSVVRVHSPFQSPPPRTSPSPLWANPPASAPIDLFPFPRNIPCHTLTSFVSSEDAMSFPTPPHSPKTLSCCPLWPLRTSPTSLRCPA